MKNVVRGLGLFVVISVGILACGAAQQAAGPAITCPSGPRPRLDCESEVHYQATTGQGELHVLNFGGAKASIGENALRHINEKVETYVASQTRLCREYNACVIDADRYHADAHEASEHLNTADQLVKQLSSAKDGASIVAASDALYANFVPESERVAPINLKLTIEAALPADAGGVTIRVPANYPVPTGTKFEFHIEVSRDAYLYLFQVDAQKKVNVLFPQNGISVENPLRTGSGTRIPQTPLTFRLDENGIGTENVYVVATGKRLDRLEETLGKFANGNAQTIDNDPLLAGFNDLKPGRSAAECAKTRGLKLDGPSNEAGSSCAKTRGLVLDGEVPEDGKVEHSMAVRSSAGDDTIIKVFPFRHVSVESYRDTLKQYVSPSTEGRKTRGIVIEE